MFLDRRVRCQTWRCGDEAAESGEKRLCGECLSRVHSCHENGVKQGGEEA